MDQRYHLSLTFAPSHCVILVVEIVGVSVSAARTVLSNTCEVKRVKIKQSRDEYLNLNI